MERESRQPSYETDIGAFSLFVDVFRESGDVEVWIGADVFEHDCDEDYPRFNLEEVLFEGFCESYGLCDGTADPRDVNAMTECLRKAIKRIEAIPRKAPLMPM